MTTINPEIRWLRLRGDAYEPLVPHTAGIIESEVFPGLRLPVAAMLTGDRAAVLAALRPEAPGLQCQVLP